MAAPKKGREPVNIAKAVPTIRVRVKKTGRKMVINESRFDSKKHEPIEE